MRERGMATLGGPYLPGPEILGKTLATVYERVSPGAGHGIIVPACQI